MKHFDAYSVESDRDQATNTFEISLKDLVEYYFVPLKSCIQNADVGAFMCSYDAINGTAAVRRHALSGCLSSCCC